MMRTSFRSIPRSSDFACITAALPSRMELESRRFMSYQAEYIWIDGTEPSPLLRSKTKIVEDGKEPPIWGFDGSSTNQAVGSDSDCVLQPVFVCPDPLRAEGDKVESGGGVGH